ncbi:GatB/YqeY domain-containing protein [Candidatus Woesebacteria bacterium]|nr:GatB/YqeY domain-containing protein [Candidatus Woesebacteria bacterium]
MTLLDTLQDEMKSAMKSRDQARLDALRFIVSAIRYFQVDNPNLNDEQIVEVLKKEAKKRRESIVAYKAAGRDELLAKEEYELGIIEEYLPKMMSEDEVRAKVKEALESAKPDNFGMAMNVSMKAVGKEAEGSMVARIVKEIFQN